MHTLYVVATPIDNLEDITLRALRVLDEVGLIAAEDTRVTRKLLQRHDIETALTSYHEHNSRTKLPVLLEALRDSDVALVSDAGVPGVNDPGHDLVRAAAKAGVSVVTVPGASAVTSAISVSGLDVDQFVYLGFLPRKKSERRRLLQTLEGEPRALVVLETPHRLRAALQDVLDTLGNRPISVCREMTKVHEEVFRGDVSEALEYFAQPKGEFTLVIGGGTEAADGPSLDPAAFLPALLAEFKGLGLGASDSVARAVRLTGIKRRQVYDLWLHLGAESGKKSARG